MSADWIWLGRIQYTIPMKHHIALLIAALLCIGGMTSASAAAPSMDRCWYRRYYYHRYYYHRVYWHPVYYHHYYYHRWRHWRHYW